MELSRTTCCHLLVNGRFSVILAGTTSIVNMDHFLVAWMVPLSFVDHGLKLRVLINAIGDWPRMAKVRPGGRKTPSRAAKRPYWKIVHSLLRVWGTYDLIESGPSESKNGFCIGVASKNIEIRTENWPRGPPCNRFNRKMLPIGCPKKNLVHFRLVL